MTEPHHTQSGALRLLIIVVAYNAQRTLVKVLDRIPIAFVRRHSTELLIVDDTSPDGTFEAGLSWAEERAESPITVLRNPRPQGYGGNLKLAFEYALENGFDAVALLHGDGKYAPEVLPALVAPIACGRADAVMGSRFLVRGAALDGGMPLYRFLGNRILTAIQNRLLGTALSDFHTGYRAYSTALLRGIPFRYNANDLHFDTEVIVQMVRAGFRVVEVPIPTYYGDQLSYRRGVAYAKNSLASTVAAVLDSVGIKYRRKYDISGAAPKYAIKLGYKSSHTLAIASVTPGARVLDVGCGAGYVSERLLAKNCHVVGIDQHPPDPTNVSEFIEWKLDCGDLPVSLADYDFMLLLDIIEHLPNPERFLEAVRRSSELKQPTIILTAPNVGFLPIRIMLVLGQFNYGKEGILDFSHTRLFTCGSLRDMLEQIGYEVLEVQGIPAPFPKALGNTKLARALVVLNDLCIRLSRQLFAYQLFLKIRPLPTVNQLLADTIRYSAARRMEREEKSSASGGAP